MAGAIPDRDLKLSTARIPGYLWLFSKWQDNPRHPTRDDDFRIMRLPIDAQFTMYRCCQCPKNRYLPVSVPCPP